MLNYLKDFFMTAGTVSNTQMCLAIFLLTALTWSFSFGHKFWGLLATLAMVFFTIILYKIPGQYLWFRPMPGLIVGFWLLYQFAFFFRYRQAIFELIQGLQEKQKSNLFRESLFVRMPASYRDVPIWVLPLVVFLGAVALIGASFVEKTNQIAASNKQVIRADSVSIAEDRETKRRLEQVEALVVEEISTLKLENDSLTRFLAKKADVANQAAQEAKEIATRRYNANRKRIERLEARLTLPTIKARGYNTSYVEGDSASEDTAQVWAQLREFETGERYP